MYGPKGVGPERSGETSQTKEFLRPIQPEEKEKFERLFPLHDKDVRGYSITASLRLLRIERLRHQSRAACKQRESRRSI